MKASRITSVDFFEDLSSPYARKRFFWGFVLLGLLCTGGIWLFSSIIPQNTWTEVAKDVLTNILASIVVIVAFYFLYFHFIGPNPGLREMVPLRSQDIQTKLASLTKSARYYYFWGRSGSYFRSTPLIKLAEQARSEKAFTSIHVVLPDPSEPRLIKAYGDILKSLGEDNEGNKLLANVLATSTMCAIIGANNKYVQIKVYYSKFLPAFRVDMSDKGAVLTQDDPAKQGLFFEGGSEFHEMFRTTVTNEMLLSREVAWPVETFENLELDGSSSTAAILAQFGLPLGKAPDDVAKEVALMIEKRSHRYK